MLPKLKNSLEFKKDLKSFQISIENIPYPNAKEKALHLLQKIMLEANILDESHNPITNNDIDPRAVRSNVENMVELRKELTKLINDSK